MLQKRYGRPCIRIRIENENGEMRWSSRPNILQCWCKNEVRFVTYFGNVDRHHSRLENCQMFGRDQVDSKNVDFFPSNTLYLS